MPRCAGRDSGRGVPVDSPVTGQGARAGPEEGKPPGCGCFRGRMGDHRPDLASALALNPVRGEARSRPGSLPSSLPPLAEEALAGNPAGIRGPPDPRELGSPLTPAAPPIPAGHAETDHIWITSARVRRLPPGSTFCRGVSFVPLGRQRGPRLFRLPNPRAKAVCAMRAP